MVNNQRTVSETRRALMKVGLIGHQGSGKTTIFNVLTGQQAAVGEYSAGFRGEIHLGVIKVPDPRVERLGAIFKPKKTTHAEITFADFPVDPVGEKGPAAIPAQMREVDAMALVLGDFSPGAKPLKDLVDLMAEMILADLGIVERRLERLRKERGSEIEIKLFERALEWLEGERCLRELSMTPEEESLISGFGLLSCKPVLALFNTSEERAGKLLPRDYEEGLRRRGVAGLSMAGRVEMEIAQLDEADRSAFLAAMGIPGPARDRFIRAVFDLLDLVTFLTHSPNEVRAWTVQRGTPAKKAAGKIHSDMERGFIRAEVVAYDEFIALGSEAKCREAGKLRLEGKDYPVHDGDIIHFRFNV
jgi:ribosome-binding ATPase